MRLIDADALIEKWYEINDIGQEDRGARFIGYTEIPRFINNAPTVETTGDLISRADALNLNCVITVRRADTKERKTYDEIIKACFEAYVEHIKKLPSAEAVQGEWIDVENEPYCECSVCGAYIDNLDDDYAFCPRCGATMKGGAK